jgi:tetratricopeptide (TPR) repeat protein
MVRLAIIAWDQRDTASAEALLRQSVKLAPQYETAWLNLGGLLREKGDTDGAMQAFARSVAVTPDFYPGHLAMAQVKEDQGDLASALEYATRAVQVDAASAESYSNLGRILTQLKRWDEAAAAFDAALSRDPRHIEALLNKASLYSQRGRPELAEQVLLRAWKWEPGNVAIVARLSALAWERRHYRDALQWAQRALAIQPNDLLMLHRVSLILSSAPDAALRNPVAALEISTRLCTATGNEIPEILDVHAAALAASGRFDEAASFVRAAMALSEAQSTQSQSTQSQTRQLRLSEYSNRQLVLLPAP